MLSKEIKVKQVPDLTGNVDDCNVQHYDIYAGNKRLDLIINFNSNTAFSRVENVRNAIGMAGATTAVYRRLAEIVQASARFSGKAIKYRFLTSYPSMEEWAKTRGQEIFNWDQMGMDGTGFFEALKTFSPEVTLEPDLKP